jgi:hypothetical protein
MSKQHLLHLIVHQINKLVLHGQHPRGISQRLHPNDSISVPAFFQPFADVLSTCSLVVAFRTHIIAAPYIPSL